jgi:hypothetical protein
MFKFLKKLFGPAKMPANYAAEIEAEGIVLIDLGVTASVTRTNFHRPGKYAAWEKRGFFAHIALTKTRLLILNGSNPVINVPLADERLRQMNFSLEGEDVVHVRFDAGLFQPTWSGTIEYRFHTPQARDYIQKLS